MCSFRACTAPPLPCETYPAQRPSIRDNEQYFRCFFVANRSFYCYCRTMITSFSYNSTVSLLRPSFSGPNVSLTATNYPNSRIYMVIIQGWRTTTSECFHHSSLKRRFSAPTRVISSSLSSSPSSPPLLLFPGSRRKLPAPSEASIADFIFADTLVDFFLPLPMSFSHVDTMPTTGSQLIMYFSRVGEEVTVEFLRSCVWERNDWERVLIESLNAQYIDSMGGGHGEEQVKLADFVLLALERGYSRRDS